ncbi:hypothetical protein LzC2_04020 [Planctomycetes bacterium LzC2]|uniref:Uncharacterized protein n=1 Tax=Alienimonas chondri TaxID=2681879 RepID=A0ABX1VBC4_9PLAN|nr:hypothetical protein [Alienimonas chondri]
MPASPATVSDSAWYPLANAVEFDRGTDGNSRPGYPRERKLERVDLDGIADMGVGRGFLAVAVPALGLVVAVAALLRRPMEPSGTATAATLGGGIVFAAMAGQFCRKAE